MGGNRIACSQTHCYIDKSVLGARPCEGKMAADFDLERLYDAHAQPLFSYVLSLTRDEQDTREVLQEVFAKLARQPALLGSVRDERAFLVRLAHNIAIDLIRRRGTRSKYHAQFSVEQGSPFAATA